MKHLALIACDWLTHKVLHLCIPLDRGFCWCWVASSNSGWQIWVNHYSSISSDVLRIVTVAYKQNVPWDDATAFSFNTRVPDQFRGPNRKSRSGSGCSPWDISQKGFFLENPLMNLFVKFKLEKKSHRKKWRLLSFGPSVECWSTGAGDEGKRRMSQQEPFRSIESHILKGLKSSIK